MLSFDSDIYQGITIHNKLPHDPVEFSSELAHLILVANQLNKRIVWLTLSHSQSHLIDSATKQGFVFHSCMEYEITLTLRLVEDVYVPFSPTHTIGLGGIVLRDSKQHADKKEVLVIKEHLGHYFKLPGGHMELDETIAEGVSREVYEETGVITELDSIVGVASKYPYQLGKSNIYLACLLIVKNDAITIYDTAEIAEAKWMQVEDFLNSDESAPFAMALLKSTLNAKGLMPFGVDFIHATHGEKRELFHLG